MEPLGKPLKASPCDEITTISSYFWRLYIYILFAPLYPHFTTKLVDYLNIQFTKNYANEIMIPMI